MSLHMQGHQEPYPTVSPIHLTTCAVVLGLPATQQQIGRICGRDDASHPLLHELSDRPLLARVAARDGVPGLGDHYAAERAATNAVDSEALAFDAVIHLMRRAQTLTLLAIYEAAPDEITPLELAIGVPDRRKKAYAAGAPSLTTVAGEGPTPATAPPAPDRSSNEGPPPV